MSRPVTSRPPAAPLAAAVRCGVTLLVAAAALHAQPFCLVHLPSTPVQAANRQAEAVTALVDYLSREVPGLGVDAKIFRRYQDAEAFLRSNGADVVFMLTDASFLLDVTDPDLVPAYRFERAGQGTYRRQLVVKADSAAASVLDLAGRSLSVVETAGPSAGDFLTRAVFVGEVDPSRLFSGLEVTADDFAATANVVYGKTDAGLVSELNPLLLSHLGGALKVIYTSPPLSLPVLTVRRAALDPAQLAALDRALDAAGASAAVRPALSELGIDGVGALDAAAGRMAVLGVAPDRAKQPEVALPPALELALDPPPLPAPGDLPFTLSVELPEVPLLAEEPE